MTFSSLYNSALQVCTTAFNHNNLECFFSTFSTVAILGILNYFQKTSLNLSWKINQWLDCSKEYLLVYAIIKCFNQHVIWCRQFPFESTILHGLIGEICTQDFKMWQKHIFHCFFGQGLIIQNLWSQVSCG